MKFYSSYKEAHEQLQLPGSWQRGTIGNASTGLSSIKLTANPKSLDRISPDLDTVYYVGRGQKGSPGEPVKSQDSLDQQVFYRSLHTRNPVTVLAKLKTGFVVFLGQYEVTSIRLVAMKGVEYYQIKLVFIKHNGEDKSSSKPQY
jgi:hypothetical protein